MIAAVAFAAAMLAAVTGFRSAAVLLPVLVFAFAIGQAIPILTVARLRVEGNRARAGRGTVTQANSSEVEKQRREGIKETVWIAKY